MHTVVCLPRPTSVTQCHLSEIFLGSHGPSLRAILPSQLFHEAAYQADDRQDLLGAISEFLDGSIVIPPSEVEGRDLLRSVAAFQRELLRKRREREQTKVEMTTRGGYVAPGKGQTPAQSFVFLPSLPTMLGDADRASRQEEVACVPLVSCSLAQNCLWRWGAPRQPLKMIPCSGRAQCLGVWCGM